MSKAVHSPLGQWRGRTGGQVYRVNHGEQIVSAYQPKVSNPRTDNQQRQRAKFNLMTKLNAITPTILLRPFSPTPGIARPMFSKSLMKYIEVSDIESTVSEVVYQARIAAADIHFGEGATYLPEGVSIGEVGSASISAYVAPNGVAVEMDAGAFADGVVAVRVIDVCRTVGEGGHYIDVRYYDFTEPAVHTFDGEGMQHRIYVQFVVRRSTTSSLSTGVITDEGEDGSEIIADSSQLINSGSVVGSSIYVNALWVPAGE